MPRTTLKGLDAGVGELEALSAAGERGIPLPISAIHGDNISASDTGAARLLPDAVDAQGDVLRRAAPGVVIDDQLGALLADAFDEFVGFRPAHRGTVARLLGLVKPWRGEMGRLGCWATTG